MFASEYFIQWSIDRLYNPGTCQIDYGGPHTKAFSIEKVENLPDGQQCYVQVYPEDNCMGNPNWMGAIKGTGGCLQSTNPDTGEIRLLSSFRLVCCESFGECVKKLS